MWIIEHNLVGYYRVGRGSEVKSQNLTDDDLYRMYELILLWALLYIYYSIFINYVYT